MDRRNVNAEKWQNWDNTFSWFNGLLFEKKLTVPLFQPSSHTTIYGVFVPNGSLDEKTGEVLHCVNFHPSLEALQPVEIMSYIVYQMTHQWCYEVSDKKKHDASYCSKQFLEKFESFGFIVDKQKQKRNVAFIIDTNGAFYEHAHTYLGLVNDNPFSIVSATSNNLIKLSEGKGSKQKATYTCPQCGSKTWGKPGLRRACMDCTQPREDGLYSQIVLVVES